MINSDLEARLVFFPMIVCAGSGGGWGGGGGGGYAAHLTIIDCSGRAAG